MEIIAAILTIIIDIWFFKVMSAGQPIDAIIMLIIFIMPIFTMVAAAISAAVATGILYILGFIIELIFSGIKIFSGTNPTPPKPKTSEGSGGFSTKGEERARRMAIRNRCDALLTVADSIEQSNLRLKYDPSFINYRSTIRSTMTYDYNTANAYCDMLEEFLLDNSDSVAMTTAGYRWLASKGGRY